MRTREKNPNPGFPYPAAGRRKEAIMAPTVLTLANGDVLLAEHATEQTVAFARLYSDAGLTRWLAAAVRDERKHLQGYFRELVVILEAEIEARSDAYRLGVEAEHYLATR